MQVRCGSAGCKAGEDKNKRGGQGGGKPDGKCGCGDKSKPMRGGKKPK